MAKAPAPNPDDLRALDPNGDFIRRLRDDHRAVDALADTHDLKPLKLIAHQLAGAAATFGYPNLGDVATELDEHFLAHDVTAEDVARLLAALEQALKLPGKSA